MPVEHHRVLAALPTSRRTRTRPGPRPRAPRPPCREEGPAPRAAGFFFPGRDVVTSRHLSCLHPLLHGPWSSVRSGSAPLFDQPRPDGGRVQNASRRLTAPCARRNPCPHLIRHRVVRATAHRVRGTARPAGGTAHRGRGTAHRAGATGHHPLPTASPCTSVSPRWSSRWRSAASCCSRPRAMTATETSRSRRPPSRRRRRRPPRPPRSRLRPPRPQRLLRQHRRRRPHPHPHHLPHQRLLRPRHRHPRRLRQHPRRWRRDRRTTTCEPRSSGMTGPTSMLA